MLKILVQTGFGYFKDQQGRIVSKAQLPPGQHELKDDLIYVEVDSQAELDAIEVYTDPAIIATGNIEAKIWKEIRAAAIQRLKDKGELPADFKD